MLPKGFLRSKHLITVPTLTIKNIPEALYHKLKERALRHHRSMNNEVIACLEQILLPMPCDDDALIREAEALNQKVGKTFPDMVGEAKREGRA